MKKTFRIIYPIILLVLFALVLFNGIWLFFTGNVLSILASITDIVVLVVFLVIWIVVGIITKMFK